MTMVYLPPAADGGGSLPDLDPGYVRSDGAGGFTAIGTIPTTDGGTGITTYTKGDVIYSPSDNTLTVLPGNTTTTPMFFMQTGDGVDATAPAWVEITKSTVGLGNVENTALSTWAGSTAIDTVGVVTTGTWMADAISVSYGGTGGTTATTGFDNLSPLTTIGDTLYHDGSHNVRLAGNTTTTKKFYSQTGDGVDSAAPVWTTLSGADVGLGNVENTALSTWGGSSNLTTAGTITSGTWEATPVADSYIASAATWNAKLTSVLTSAYVFVGNGSNVATGVAISGDVSISNTGALTLANVVSGATVGSTSKTLSLTFDNKGRITAASASDIAIAQSQVTNLTTDLAAKLSTTLASAKVLVGNGSNVATAVDFSGAFTIDNAGVATLATVAIAKGGTGQTTKAAAYDALSPMTTLGDTEYYDGTHGVRLAGNTTATKKFLSQTGNGSVSAAPSWSTVTSSDVGLGNVENTALSTWAGTSNIVTVGVITTGTWSADAIAVAKGGTGATSANAGFNNLSPLTTLGDTLYFSIVNARLAGSTSATMAVLTQTGNGSVSAAPAWTSTTGTGKIAREDTPTFITPILGVASGTSVAAASTVFGAFSAGAALASNIGYNSDGSTSNLAATSAGFQSSITHTITSNNALGLHGFRALPQINQNGFNGTASSGTVVGVYSDPRVIGSTGTVSFAISHLGTVICSNGGTTDVVYNFEARGATNNSSTINYAVGFHCSNFTAGTNAYAAQLSLASGTNRWNIFADGTAVNHIKGALLLNTTTNNGVDQLQVTGSISGTTSLVTGNILSAFGNNGSLNANTVYVTSGTVTQAGSTTMSYYALLNHTLTADSSASHIGFRAQNAINQAGFNATASAALTGFYSDPRVNGSSGTVTATNGYVSVPRVASGSTVTTLNHYKAEDAINSGTITTQVGLNIVDLTVGTTNYAIRCQVTSGTNKWNLFLDGTALNHIKGVALFNTTTNDTVNQVQIAGSLGLQSASSNTVAGSVWYDGKTFNGNPVASNAAILEAVHFCALSADYTGSDVNTAQKVFNSTTNGTITLAASTTYDFEAHYVITRAAGTTSHTLAVLFGGTATLTSIMYSAESTSSTGNVLTAVSAIYATAATATTVTAASTSATENVIIKLRGVIRINAAGTIIPQIQYSAAPGGAPTILKNSFIQFSPRGTNTVVTAGNWS